MALKELIEDRRNKLEAIKRMNINPYPYSYEKNISSQQLKRDYADMRAGEEDKTKTYSLAGRILSKRDFGKLIFMRLDDHKGVIQLAIRKNENEKLFTFVKKYIDVGDIVGIRGFVFRTHKGELTIMINELTLLSKCLRPLPEKWHGLKDIDERYRKRYVDLIVNRNVREVFIKRAEILKLTREFFNELDFLEVEIPILQPIYGGAFAKPFTTYSNAWKKEYYLSISPELYLKKLLVGGFERVYTITKAFRNEDVDTTHNPEFTTLEAYAAYWDYNKMMDVIERLFKQIADRFSENGIVVFDSNEIDFNKPFKRISVSDCLKSEGISEDISDKELKKLLKENEIELPSFDRGLAFTELFEKLCEHKFINPTFAIDYYKESTPLCKLHRKNKRFVERFELFINGIEFANAYSELNDPVIQKEFFEKQLELRKQRGEYQPYDESFIEALEYGMPPASGVGIGVDRLIMLFTNSTSIKDVILFPQMKEK